MTSKLISQGAEANIYLKNNLITKHRIRKSYRIKEIDEKLRTRRTRAETKILNKVSKIGLSPQTLNLEKQKTKTTDKIIMPYISGKKLSQHLDEFPLEKQKQILKQIGLAIAQIHNKEIIHGDLTTSNMILTDNKISPETSNPKSQKKASLLIKTKNQQAKSKQFKIIFIDFGLGFHSSRYEDKAVDLHLFKQALEAKHFQNWEILFKEFLKSYKKTAKNSDKILSQFKKVESRGRYKH